MDANAWPPADNSAFARMMRQHGGDNATLLSYVYPTAERVAAMKSRDPRDGWVPFTDNCRPANDCYCFHVAGEMSYSKGPLAWQKCMHHHTWPNIGTCPEAQHDERLRSCGCLTDAAADASHPCLYSDMRPSKLLAVITAARLAGIDHIVEEGRCESHAREPLRTRTPHTPHMTHGAQRLQCAERWARDCRAAAAQTAGSPR